MEIKLSVKSSNGDTFEVIREFSEVSSLRNLSDLENLVQDYGHSVLPELESHLLSQMSVAFEGKKNRA